MLEMENRLTGKEGHHCPACLAEQARPLEPGEPAASMPRSTTLHWSKKAPGELECPNCKGTFPVAKAAAAVEPEPEPKPTLKKKAKGE